MKILRQLLLLITTLIILPCELAQAQETQNEAESICSQFVSLYRSGQLEEAEQLIRKAIESEKAKKLPDSDNLLPFLRNLVSVLRKENKLDQVPELEAEIRQTEHGVAIRRSSIKAVPAGNIAIPDDGKDNYLQFTQMKNRWAPSSMPLKVFIKDGEGVAGYKGQYHAILKQAFADWTEASGGKIVFDFVDDINKALIECSWAEKGESIHAGLTLAASKKAGEISDAHIRVFTFNSAARAYATESQIRISCLHEIGHALGLSGHSDRTSDIMFYASTARGISARDKRTLAALYSTPDESLEKTAEQPQQSKATEHSEESVWVPSSISSIFHDGVDALNQRKISLAIEKFKKALELAPNYVFAKRELARAYSLLAIENWAEPVYALCLFHRSYYTQNESITQKNIDTLIRNMHLNPQSFEARVKLAEEAAKNSDDFGVIVEYEAALKIKHSADIENRLKSSKRPSLLAADLDRSKLVLKSPSPGTPPSSSTLSLRPEYHNAEIVRINNEGATALNNGNHLQATKKFLEALKLSPGYHRAQQNLAIAFNNLGGTCYENANNALQCCHLSSYLDPTNPFTQNMHVTIKKLGLDPNSFDDRVRLGDEALSKGDRIGAIVEYTEALKIKDDEPLKSKLAGIPRPSIPNEIQIPIFKVENQLNSLSTQQIASNGMVNKAPIQQPQVPKPKAIVGKPVTATATAKAQVGTLTGIWHGTIHVDSADFQVSMELELKGSSLTGSITCTGNGGISKHHFRGVFDQKNAAYICKDFGVEKITGSGNWFPTAVDEYSINPVENNTKLVGSCTQANQKSWFSLKR